MRIIRTGKERKSDWCLVLSFCISAHSVLGEDVGGRCGSSFIWGFLFCIFVLTALSDGLCFVFIVIVRSPLQVTKIG